MTHFVYASAVKDLLDPNASLGAVSMNAMLLYQYPPTEYNRNNHTTIGQVSSYQVVGSGYTGPVIATATIGTGAGDLVQYNITTPTWVPPNNIIATGVVFYSLGGSLAAYSDFNPALTVVNCEFVVTCNITIDL